MFTLAGHNEPNSRSLSASIDDAVSSCICDADIASKLAPLQEPTSAAERAKDGRWKRVLSLSVQYPVWRT
jgi:hypothetical protein